MLAHAIAYRPVRERASFCSIARSRTSPGNTGTRLDHWPIQDLILMASPETTWPGASRPGHGSRLGGKDCGHPTPFHRGVLLELSHFLESLEHFLHDPAALVDMGELAAPEEHVHEDLVLVFEKLLGRLTLTSMSWSPVFGRTRISLTWIWCCFCFESFFFWVYLNLP